MNDDVYRFAEIVAWLKEKGHSEEEVEKILERVRQYDQQTNFLSEMDSLDSDDFGIDAIIAEALSDVDESDAS